MPQITINEIDQSVVTRVVHDDRVHILVPVISSFGPSYDDTNVSANTFTDVTAYDRVYGYTPAQFNPVQSDTSRTYARELIKKGAAVSVVRINGGQIAEFELGGTSVQRQTPSYTTVTRAAMRSEQFEDDCAEKAGISVTFGTTTDHAASTSENNDIKNMLPGTFKIVGTIGSGGSAVEFELFDDGHGNLISTSNDGLGGTVNYATSIITVTGLGTTDIESAMVTVYAAKSTIDWNRYTFAPQISYIKAKYSGSFGNNLLVAISAVNTSRLAESFQYANITVYYVDRTVVYDTFGNVDISKSFVKNVTMLETKMVSTNPNDPRYFEDVQFDFIEIKGTLEARDELTLVWSNINANPASTSTYPGFPVIPLKVSIAGSDYAYGYNYDAFATKTFGTDFFYTSTMLDKLKTGFKGYIPSGGAGGWQQSDVNQYIREVYGPVNTTSGLENPGIFVTLMSNLTGLYKHFTDPYIYDFDFISSGGFVYEEYVVNTEGAAYTYRRTVPMGSNGSVVYTGLSKLHEAMLYLVNSRKDCMALIDAPDEYDPYKLVEYSRIVNTSYATMYYPWCYVNSPYITGAQMLMCPSYIFLYTFLQNLDNNVDAQKWFPPAGVTRATARVVKKPKFEIGSVLLDDWQNDNTSRVNPIMKLKQYGYVIYGQYTCLEAIDMFTHSALESVNVRLVANAVKKKIFDVCLNLAFDPNTETLWDKFFDQMDQYLRYMKYNEGVYDYRIVMDESTVTTDAINHLRCPGKVYIAPTRTAEFFDIDFIITDAGAEFTN